MMDIWPTAGAAQHEAARRLPRNHFAFIVLSTSFPGFGADGFASWDLRWHL